MVSNFDWSSFENFCTQTNPNLPNPNPNLTPRQPTFSQFF